MAKVIFMVGDMLLLVHGAMISITAYTSKGKLTTEKETNGHNKCIHQGSEKLVNKGLYRGTGPDKKDLSKKFWASIKKHNKNVKISLGWITLENDACWTFCTSTYIIINLRMRNACFIMVRIASSK